MKNCVVDKEVSRSFRYGEVDVSLQREFSVGEVLPIIVALPVAVEVEVCNVIATRFVAECLIEDRCEV